MTNSECDCPAPEWTPTDQQVDAALTDAGLVFCANATMDINVGGAAMIDGMRNAVAAYCEEADTGGVGQALVAALGDLHMCIGESLDPVKFMTETAAMQKALDTYQAKIWSNTPQS